MGKATHSDGKDYLCPEDVYLQAKDVHLQPEYLYLQPEYIPFSILRASLSPGQGHFEAKGKHPDRKHPYHQQLPQAALTTFRSNG